MPIDPYASPEQFETSEYRDLRRLTARGRLERMEDILHELQEDNRRDGVRSRALSLAITAFEESMLWLGKIVKDNAEREEG